MFNSLINFSNFLIPIFYKLLYMSVVGSILGLLILIIINLFDRKLTAKWKCIMFSIPLMFLIIPINRIQIPTKKELPISTTIIDRVESSITSISSLNKDEDIPIKVNNNQIETYSSPNEVTYNNKISLYNILPIIWIIGLIINILMIIIGNLKLKLIIKKLQQLEDDRIKLILVKCKRRLNINKNIEIRLYNYNTSPCIYGIIRPKILISEEFIKNNNNVIENVLMHELSHYKRKDMITNIILLIIISIHWFNPIVFKLFTKIRQEMELATDEIALSKMDVEEKKQYGQTLVRLLQVYNVEKVTTKMLCITDDSKNMERRIRKIKLSIKLKEYKKSIIIILLTSILIVSSPFIVKLNSNAISEEDNLLYKKVEEYLIKKEQEKHNIARREFAINNDNFNVLVDVDKLGIEKNEEETYVYVNAKIHYSYEQEEVSNSSYLNNYKFTIKNNEIIDCSIINNQEENMFIGKWKPFKAELNNEEVPLTTIYGSMYNSGELIFNVDGTYTELIGVYSDDVINNLTGKFEMYRINEQVILTANNNKTKMAEIIESSSINTSNNVLVLSEEDGTRIYFREAF